MPYTEADILKTRILVWAPLPTFRGPTSHYKMTGLEIFPHPTCEVKESGDCECLHPISHMASEKWAVGLKREFPFLKYLPQDGPEVLGKIVSLFWEAMFGQLVQWSPCQGDNGTLRLASPPG